MYFFAILLALRIKFSQQVHYEGKWFVSEQKGD